MPPIKVEFPWKKVGDVQRFTRAVVELEKLIGPRSNGDRSVLRRFLAMNSVHQRHLMYCIRVLLDNVDWMRQLPLQVNGELADEPPQEER
jgi:hypothetical protein